MRLNRVTKYVEFHMAVRIAILQLINAAERARVAQALHPSRQARHLDVAEASLQEAINELRTASKKLKPLRKFRSYEERRPR